MPSRGTARRGSKRRSRFAGRAWSLSLVDRQNTPGQDKRSSTMRIWCDCFSDGDEIPRRFTGDGEDRSPPLAWEDAPAETREFALVCLDPDAPSPQPWVHWLVYRLANDACALPENLPPISRLETPVVAYQGRNSWSSGRTIGYRGPAPPIRHGPHRYVFQLFALDAPLSLYPGIDQTALLQAMAGHVLAEAKLTGVYERT